jgi:hypothetical protein
MHCYNHASILSHSADVLLSLYQQPVHSCFFYHAFAPSLPAFITSCLFNVHFSFYSNHSLIQARLAFISLSIPAIAAFSLAKALLFMYIIL